MQQSHLLGVLSNWLLKASDTPIIPGQRTPLYLLPRKTSEFLGGSRLRPAARIEVEEVYASRLKTNTQVTKLDCVMLHDLLALLRKCPGVVEQLGFTGNSYKKWKEQLRTLRDTLAHGGGLLHAESDPLRAIQLFEDVRTFAEKTTSLIANVAEA
jgi:hypothetical protein